MFNILAIMHLSDKKFHNFSSHYTETKCSVVEPGGLPIIFSLRGGGGAGAGRGGAEAYAGISP